MNNIKKSIRVFFLLSILGLISPIFLILYSSKKIHHDLEIPYREVGIVLGAGIKSDGTPGPNLLNRLQNCLALYRNGKIQKVLLSGDNSRTQYDEISTMYLYLTQNGILGEDIFGDYAGFDTYSSMYRAKNIFGIKKATIISQHYHLPRSVFIADQLGIDVAGYCDVNFKSRKIFKIREWFACIKAYMDLVRNRKPKYLGENIEMTKESNILLDQIKMTK